MSRWPISPFLSIFWQSPTSFTFSPVQFTCDFRVELNFKLSTVFQRWIYHIKNRHTATWSWDLELSQAFTLRSRIYLLDKWLLCKTQALGFWKREKNTELLSPIPLQKRTIPTKHVNFQLTDTSQYFFEVVLQIVGENWESWFHSFLYILYPRIQRSWKNKR